MRPRHKYGAKATTCNSGHKHPSKREAARCDVLHLLQRAGEITDLEVEPMFYFVIDGVQVKHPNGRRLGFKPDWAYTEAGNRIAEDLKSEPTKTEAFVLRAALFRHLYPEIELRLTK